MLSVLILFRSDAELMGNELVSLGVGGGHTVTEPTHDEDLEV